MRRAAPSQPAWRRAATVWLLIIAAILPVVALNQSAIHWRENVVDSHLFAWHGWCLSQGARPYLDIWDNKPPGIWYLNALAFATFGDDAGAESVTGERESTESSLTTEMMVSAGVIGEIVISAAALLIGLIAFVAAARMIFQPSLTPLAVAVALVLLTHPLFECGANRTETFVVTCELLTIALYTRWWTRGGNGGRLTRGGGLGWLFAAGVFAGAAPLFKQSGLAAGAACALHLAWTQLRVGWASRPPVALGPLQPTSRSSSATEGQRYWRFAAVWRLAAAAGFCVAPLAVGLHLAWCGAIPAAWRAVGVFNRAYFDIGDATWLNMPYALGIYGEQLYALRWLLAAAAIGLAAGLWQRWRHRWDGRRAGQPGQQINQPAPPYNAATAAPGVGPDPMETDPPSTPILLPTLWFLLALYLACVGPGRRGHHFMPVLPSLGLLSLYGFDLLAGRVGLAARLAGSARGTLLLVVFGYGLLGLAGDHAALLTRCWSAKSAWYSLSYAEVQPYQLQALEIRRLTAPADRIYVWGWSPGTYRYAYRLASSRFATLEKLGQVKEEARFVLDGAVADLCADPPRLFAASVPDLRGILSKPGDLGPWLRENYEDLGVVGGMHLLLRRE